MKMQVEIELVPVRRPEGISDEDWEWVATISTMKLTAGYMYIAIFQDKERWRIYGYLHKSGLSPYYVTRASESEARSFVEQAFPEATHAHSQVQMAAPTFRALYRWGEGSVTEKEGHAC